MINKNYVDLKTIFKERDEVDLFVPFKYITSPYRACQHGCAYCDGRADKYFVKGIFDRDIEIRKNLPNLLSKKIANFREFGMFAFSSGVSDVYQQVEKDEKIMPELLQIVEFYNLPVRITTKSKLILRDLELLKKINKDNRLLVTISLTSLNNDIIKYFEPAASSVEERLEVIKTLKEVGIMVGVFATPFLPMISDDEHQMEELVVKLKELNVDFVWPSFLTLRDGNQKDFFIKRLKKYDKSLVKPYINLFSNSLHSGAPIYSYREEFFSRVKNIWQKHQMPFTMPHSFYKRCFSLYDQIWLLLMQMEFVYSLENVDIKNLVKAKENYQIYLKKERDYYYKKRSLDFNKIDENIIKRFKDGSFNEVLDNKNLFNFLKKVVLEEKIFDQLKLKLIGGKDG